ncbi:MAG: hypothetical protein EXS12_03395 [Phycisphaerales bacterium]|nr:hypothetical protein [Phycisphaerales bacterium]
MTAVHQLVERARRRLQVSESLAVAALALPITGWAMLVWIFVSRLFLHGHIAAALSSLETMMAFGAAVFMAYSALLVSLRGWPTRASAAAQLDERLNLASRMTTALSVQTCADEFSKAAIEDANRVAQDSKYKNMLSRAFAFHFGSEWRLGAIAWALVLAAWLFIPHWNPSTVKKDTQSQQDAVSLEKAVAAEAKLNDAIQIVVEVAAIDDSIAKVLESLRQVMDQANQQSSSPAQREAQAFAQQALLAAALEKASQAEPLDSNESLKDALSELPLTQGEERELMAALKRGDFEAAAKETQKLADKAKSANPAQAAAAKQALEKVAAALNKQGAAEAAKANQKMASGSQKAVASTKKSMANCKQCNSMGKACKEAADGKIKNLMDLLKKGSAASSKKKSLSQCLASSRNAGSRSGFRAGSSQSTPQLADEPDARKTQFNSEDMMSESQDLDAEPIARDFVQGSGTSGEEAARKLTVIEHQVQAGLEEGSQEDEVPAALRETHQKYFSQWKNKIDSAKSNSNTQQPPPSTTPTNNPASNAPLKPSSTP